MPRQSLADLRSARPTQWGQDSKPILSHYTGYIAYDGILKNRELWATNIHYLNDYQEFVHGYDVMRGQICEYFRDAENKDWVDNLLSKYDDLRGKISRQHIHIISFTEERNLLSQWRGYTPDGGVSISFRFAHLRDCAEVHDFDLLPCVYSEQDQGAVALEILNNNIRRHELTETADVDDVDTFVESLVFGFSRYAPLMKNQHFNEEREWRMVRTNVPYPGPQIRYHVNSTGVKPYFALPLGPATGHADIGIDSVTVGPCANYDLTFSAIGGMPDTHDVGADCFHTCQIPFRRI